MKVHSAEKFHQIVVVNSVTNKAIGSSILCLIYSTQLTYAPTICSSNRDSSIYWCNGTDEYCCTEGCCSANLHSDRNYLYNFWYFWVGLGAIFLLLIATTVGCALKCYKHTRGTLQWRTADVNNEELYRTVQDARGLIRPFLSTKQPEDGRQGILNQQSLGAGASESNDGLSPLQPPYPPLRPPHTASHTTRRNSDQIASIIMPPGFISNEQHETFSP